MNRPTITPELLRELIDYDPDTGALTWKHRGVHQFRDGVLSAAGAASIWNAQHAGRPALSSLNPDGYLGGSLLGIAVKAHRVAYAIHHGVLPRAPVAHLNGNRSDNRIGNLRKGTSARSATASGVYFNNNRWVARVTFGGERHYLGRFGSREEAVAASRAAERSHGYGRCAGQ